MLAIEARLAVEGELVVIIRLAILPLDVAPATFIGKALRDDLATLSLLIELVAHDLAGVAAHVITLIF